MTPRHSRHPAGQKKSKAEIIRERGLDYGDDGRAPRLVIVAGANGSGKSTNSLALLPASMPYINADEIAKTLPIDVSTRRDMEASRLLLARWDVMAERGESFAIETTLSSR